MSTLERALQKASALGRAANTANSARPDRSVVAPNSQAKTETQETESGRSIEIRPDMLRAGGSFAASDMEHRIAEELRLIKRPLLINAEGQGGVSTNPNLLMIASALPGAGKTFLSLNLAVSMASELDWTVLVIDGDVTRPTLSRTLGLADAPGLVNLLEQERGDLNEFVYKTNFPGLRVLPAGPSRPNVKELLGSQRMRSLVADLTAQERRIVLFDSPPLLLTSEARVLASYVGQIVLVVEAGVTPRRSVLDAIETLDSAKAINLVLNKSRQPLGIGDYHYSAYGPHAREHEQKTEG